MKTLAKVYKEQFGGIEFPFEIYDAKGNRTYREYRSGFWLRREYDAKGNRTYYETSNGVKWGTPKNSCSGKVVEIDGKKYKLKEIK